MSKNKKCSEILVQFASEIYDLKKTGVYIFLEKNKNVAFHCFSPNFFGDFLNF